MKLVIATKNRGKIAEMRLILGPMLQKKVEVAALYDMPPTSTPRETGRTFEENAKIKGLHYSDKLKVLCVADDSGLSVEALGGMPGAYSSRFAGPDATDDQNIAMLLDRLSDHPRPWKASFECVAVATLPGRVIAMATGAVHGEIMPEPRGEGGFGYDRVFLLAEYGKTMAELSTEEKNRISHRGAAMRALVAEMKNAGILPTLV